MGLKFTREVIVSALIALAMAISGAHAQDFTMRIGSGTMGDTTEEWLRLFKEGVEGKVGDKIKIEPYLNGTLGANPRLVEGVALGTVEAAAPNTGFWAGIEPSFGIFDAAGLFDTPESSIEALEKPEVRKIVTAYGSEKGMETISVFWHSPYALITKKPVRTVEDFRGLKLRTPGGAPLIVEPIKALGGLPVSMPLGDALPALQNGTIDGIISGVSVASDLKLYDVGIYMLEIPEPMIYIAAVVNSNFMKNVGPEVADVIREEATKAERPAVEWGIKDSEDARKDWVANGGKINVFDETEKEKYLQLIKSVAQPILEKDTSAYQDFTAIRDAK